MLSDDRRKVFWQAVAHKMIIAARIKNDESVSQVDKSDAEVTFDVLNETALKLEEIADKLKAENNADSDEVFNSAIGLLNAAFSAGVLTSMSQDGMKFLLGKQAAKARASQAGKIQTRVQLTIDIVGKHLGSVDINSQTSAKLASSIVADVNADLKRAGHATVSEKTIQRRIEKLTGRRGRRKQS